MLFGKIYLKPRTVLRAEIVTFGDRDTAPGEGAQHIQVHATVVSYEKNYGTACIRLECESMEQAHQYIERIERGNTPGEEVA